MQQTSDWDKRIDGGIRYKEKYGESQRWGVYKDYFRGKFPKFRGKLRVVPQKRGKKVLKA